MEGMPEMLTINVNKTAVTGVAGVLVGIAVTLLVEKAKNHYNKFQKEEEKEEE